MQIDKNSLTWKQIAGWVKGRLVEHRERLEHPMLPEREADLLRGQIAALKDLLALPDQETGRPPVGKPDTYGL